MINDVVSVILGGGKGSRLYPLTKNRSKPAVPLGGKYRLIDVPISNCINSGINKIYILTQFNSESLNRHVNTTYQFDGFSRGFVSLLAAEQTYENTNWFQGTADAVRQSMMHISSIKPSYVLILSGDQLYKMDYKELFQQHLQNKASVTIATLPVSKEDASSLGILKLGKDDRIVEFSEKPSPENLIGLESITEDIKKPYLASMGIYLFNFEVLEKLLKIKNESDFGKDIIPFCIENENVFGYKFNGYWSDIGTIRNFYFENLELTKTDSPFSLYDNSYSLFTNRRNLSPSKILNSQINQSIICEGAVIHQGKISNSIIGIRSLVGKNTEIDHSIIMGSDEYPVNLDDFFKEDFFKRSSGIGNNCVLKNCIVDKNVQIQDNVQIINKDNIENSDTEYACIRENIVVIPKNTIIPEGTII